MIISNMINQGDENKMEIKIGQQVWLSVTTPQRTIKNFETGGFVKQDKNIIVTKDFETGEEIEWQKPVFEITRVGN